MNKKYIDDYLNNIFKDIDSNIVLDYHQKRVITTNNNNIIVIAGAGSGKTTTMAAKVKFLIDIKKVNQANILVISFTNKATNEIAKLINKNFNFPNVLVTTFHKLAIKTINSNIKICNEEMQYKFVFKYIINFIFPTSKFKTFYKLFKPYLNFTKDSLYFSNFEEYHKHNLKSNNVNKFFYVDNFINKLAIPFIKKVKNNNYDIKNFYSNNVRIKFLIDIYNHYNYQLHNNNLIDFEDMISLATKTKNKPFYEYIIIDEYQDISLSRFNLIKSINYKFIMVVGDDWQSIFKFAGSDINLFINFKKILPNVIEIPILNTYRNSQQLINIASKFITKNKFQIKKELSSFKDLKYPLEICPTSNKIKTLILILNILIKKYPNKNILLLGRYNHDINFIKKSHLFKIFNSTVTYLNNPNILINFLTVHSAKGLGFDNCIILNNDNSVYGFPSKIENNPDLDIFNINPKEIVYAEERRLFYVAITRSKNKVYLLCPFFSHSTFIKEIKHYEDVFINFFVNNQLYNRFLTSFFLKL